MAFPTDPAVSTVLANQRGNELADYTRLTPDMEMVHVLFTLAAPDVAGTGLIELVRLDYGRIIIYPHVSLLAHSQFAATSDLDIGYAAYVQLDGTQVVADPNAFFDDVDAGGGALVLTPWPDVTGQVLGNVPQVFEVAGPGVEGVRQVPDDAGLIITATVATANIEVGDTIELYMAVSRGL